MALYFCRASPDATSPQVLGWILFPIEFVLNAIFFPHAQTHVRGNGTALFVLVPTLLALYIVFLLIRAVVFRAFAVRQRRQP